MNKIYTILTALLSLPIIINAQQSAWRLDKCLEHASKEHLSIQQSITNSEIAKVQYQQVKKNAYPSTFFTSEVAERFGRFVNPITNEFTTTKMIINDFNLEGAVTVYNFGKTRTNTAAYSFSAKAALADVNKVRGDISLNVASYYLQALSSKEQIAISQVQIAQTNEQINITKEKIATGTLSEIDLLQLNTQLASDSILYNNAMADYNVNISTLKSLLRVQDDNFSIVPLDSIQVSQLCSRLPSNDNSQQLLSQALENQPEQNALQYRIRSAELSAASQRAAKYPSLTFHYSTYSVFSNYIMSTPFNKWWANYGRSINTNLNQQVSVQLTIPIFSNGQLSASYKKARLDIRNLQLQLQQNALELGNTINTSYERATAAQKKWETNSRQVTTLERALLIYQERYKTGTLDILSLLTTQNLLLKARLEKSISQFDYLFRLITLIYLKEGALNI